MIIVYVKHYLNEIGRDYFDSNWFSHVQRLISQQNGFIDITTSRDEDNPECINIIVKFDTSENLYAWARNDLHQEVINNLDPYRIDKQRWFVSDGLTLPPQNIYEWES